MSNLSVLAVASIWGLVALKLSDEEIIPFNYTCYTRELEVAFHLKL
jgi:N-acetylated-alpha-linked acidic dipeptidase